MNFYSPRKIPFLAALLSAALIVMFFQSIVEFAVKRVDSSVVVIDEDDDRSYVQQNVLLEDQLTQGANKKIIYVGGSSMRELTDANYIEDGIAHFSVASRGQDLAETILILSNLKMDSTTTVVLGVTPVSLTYPLARSGEIFTTRSYPLLEYSEVRQFLYQSGIENAMTREVQSVYSSFGKYLYYKINDDVRACLARIRPSCLKQIIGEPVFKHTDYKRHVFSKQRSEAGLKRAARTLGKRIQRRKGKILKENLNRLQRFSEMVQSRGAKLVLVVLPTEPRLRPPARKHLQKTYNSFFKNLQAESGLHYVDYLNTPIVGKGDFRDALHVNESGYHKLGPVLKKLAIKISNSD